MRTLTSVLGRAALAVVLALGAAEAARGQRLDPLEAAHRNANIASDMTRQMQRAAARGEMDRVAALTERHQRAVEAALGHIRRARVRGRNVDTALAAVDRSTRIHTEVLEGLLLTVDKHAQPAIRRALDVSRTGRRQALGALRGEAPSRPDVIRQPRSPDRRSGRHAPDNAPFDAQDTRGFGGSGPSFGGRGPSPALGGPAPGVGSSMGGGPFGRGGGGRP